jgi:hypothetical protein
LSFQKDFCFSRSFTLASSSISFVLVIIVNGVLFSQSKLQIF